MFEFLSLLLTHTSDVSWVQ